MKVNNLFSKLFSDGKRKKLLSFQNASNQILEQKKSAFLNTIEKKLSLWVIVGNDLYYFSKLNDTVIIEKEKVKDFKDSALSVEFTKQISTLQSEDTIFKVCSSDNLLENLALLLSNNKTSLGLSQKNIEDIFFIILKENQDYFSLNVFELEKDAIWLD